MRISMVAVLLATAGCAAGESCPPAPEPGCRYEVRGACAVLDPADPLQVGGVDVPARLERGIAAGATYWGADPDRVVAGMTIVVREHPVWMDGELALGAASSRCRMIYLSDGESPVGHECPGCIELMLPHEIGHLALPEDRGHQDPRWANVDYMGAALCLEPLTPRAGATGDR